MSKWFHRIIAKYPWWWVVALIVVIAVIVRCWGFGHNPPSLYWDEMSLLYDGWSIAETGKDLHGHSWPLVAFESFGDYKPSGYFYLVALSIKLLGLHEWAVRVPSLVAGILIVILVGLLSEKMFAGLKWRGWRLSWLVMLVAALNPSLIHLSHVGFETNVATMWVLLGVVLLYPTKKRQEKKIDWSMIFGEIALLLAFYTYHATRVVAPCLGIYLVSWRLWSCWQNQKHNKQWWRACLPTLSLMAGIAMVVVWPFLFGDKGQLSSRFVETSIFGNQETIIASNQCREVVGETLMSRVWCHRYWFWLREIVSRFTSHLSFDYLALVGDSNGRHSVGWWGILFPWEVIGFWAGVLWLVEHRKTHLSATIFTCFWLVMGLIPASITLATPHLLRSENILPLLLVIISLGWVRLASLVTKKWQEYYWIILVVIYLGGAVVWNYYYHSYYRVADAAWWQDGYREADEVLARWQELYPQLPVYVTREMGRPSIYYFWYRQLQPEQVQAQAGQEKMDQGEFVTWSPDNIFFGTGWLPQEQLFVLSPEEYEALEASEEAEPITNSAGEVVLLVGHYADE